VRPPGVPCTGGLPPAGGCAARLPPGCGLAGVFVKADLMTDVPSVPCTHKRTTNALPRELIGYQGLNRIGVTKFWPRWLGIASGERSVGFVTEPSSLAPPPPPPFGPARYQTRMDSKPMGATASMPRAHRMRCESCGNSPRVGQLLAPHIISLGRCGYCGGRHTPCGFCSGCLITASCCAERFLEGMFGSPLAIGA